MARPVPATNEFEMKGQSFSLLTLHVVRDYGKCLSLNANLQTIIGGRLCSIASEKTSYGTMTSELCRCMKRDNLKGYRFMAGVLFLSYIVYHIEQDQTPVNINNHIQLLMFTGV
jgi:hypothetical protein